MAKVKKTDYLYIAIFILFPLWNVTKGLEFADTTCSLANYVYLDHLDSLWMYGYYLSNLLGGFFSILPFGNTMVGMNFYTSFLLSGTAVIAYVFLKNKIQREILFIGIMLALGLSWCPTVILYNYLTYFFFTLASVCLYVAIVRKQEKWYVIAGVLLGMNIFARFPNVLEAALMLVVFYDAAFFSKGVIRKTLLCVGGYLAGVAICLLAIALTGQIGEFVEMIGGLLFISKNSAGYSFADMLLSMVRGYTMSFPYLALLIAACVLGVAASYILNKKFAENKMLHRIFYIGYSGCMVLLLFVLYRRGLWLFNYSAYESFFKLAAIFLMITIVCCVMVLISKKESHEEKILAAIVLVIVLISPFGSNNGIFPSMNNLYLAAPFTLHILYKKTSKLPTVRISCAMFMAVLLVQALLFKMGFVARAGEPAWNLTTKVEGIERLEGIKTSEKNAESIMGLAEYLSSNELDGSPAILYGNIPGLYYIFDLKPAITNLWADLESNPSEVLKEDLENMEGCPVLIVGSGVNLENKATDKEQMLYDYVTKNHYEVTYQNEGFVVYEAVTGNH